MEKVLFPDVYSEATCTFQDEFPTCDWCHVRIDRRQQLTTKKDDAGTLSEQFQALDGEVLEAVATLLAKVAGWLEALAEAAEVL
jgi:hypothetical protein